MNNNKEIPPKSNNNKEVQKKVGLLGKAIAAGAMLAASLSPSSKAQGQEHSINDINAKIASVANAPTSPIFSLGSATKIEFGVKPIQLGSVGLKSEYARNVTTINSNPHKYEFSQIQPLFLKDQKSGIVEGSILYTYLKDNNLLRYCLTLDDAETINRNGIEAFRELLKKYDTSFLPLWGSVGKQFGVSIPKDPNTVFVPILLETDGKIDLRYMLIVIRGIPDINGTVTFNTNAPVAFIAVPPTGMVLHIDQKPPSIPTNIPPEDLVAKK